MCISKDKIKTSEVGIVERESATGSEIVPAAYWSRGSEFTPPLYINAVVVLGDVLFYVGRDYRCFVLQSLSVRPELAAGYSHRSKIKTKKTPWMALPTVDLSRAR